MARKVFISFLGTNNYVECIYNIDGRLSKPVRFVQEALINDICTDWTDDDRIYIFCTKEAADKNWENDGHAKGTIGLKESLMFKKDILKKVDIDDGFSEEEIWNIFTSVFNRLQPEDEIYFDITHAFRSIPMLTTVLFNYSRVMNNTNLVSIKYGAFEKLGPTFKVREMPLEKRIAPVLELKNIADLQFYTEAASNLEKFGRVESLSIAIKKPNKKCPPLTMFANASVELVKDISTNRMEKIKSGKSIKNINDSLKPIRRERIPQPVRLIMNKLLSYTQEFVGEDSFKNVEAAIKWVIRYEMFPQAYTMLQEYLITRVGGVLSSSISLDRFADKDDQSGEKNFRMFVSALLSIPDYDISCDNYKGVLKLHEDLAKQLLENNELVKDIRPNYLQLGKTRNEINHAKKTDRIYETLKSELEYIYKQTIEKHFIICS